MASNPRVLISFNDTKENMKKSITQAELSNLVGTWNQRGFHGHKRSLTRIEFSNFYRQTAKPPPPEKFLLRQSSAVTSHPFSKHDNKQNFLNDSTLFDIGIGKKKIKSLNTNQWVIFLLSKNNVN